MKRLLVTGISGLLGSNIALSGKNWRNFKIFGTFNSTPVTLGQESVKMDLRNEQEVARVLQDVHPDIIIHAAAYTDVDGCEENQKLARAVNVKGTERIVNYAEKTGTKVVYISTDYVFDGETGNYTENDEVDPVDYYGQTKLDGEKIISTLENYLICRISVLYGFEPTDTLNFATWLLRELRQENTVKLIDDQYVTPTLASNAGRAIKFLLEERKQGVYHISGRECVNRYDFGVKLAEVFDLDTHLIQRAKMRQMNWTAARPKRSCLNTDKLKREGFEPMNVMEGLKEFKSQEERGWFK